jgi:hypothetical protein
MTVLRHSRDITRFQRERMILKRKNHPVAQFFNVPSPNWYSKHHFTDCSCDGCAGLKYQRAQFDWRRSLVDQDYAALAKSDNQKKGW